MTTTTHAPKTAVVTGAGSGIGRAVAHALLRDGYHVVLAGRNEAHLHDTAADATGPGAATVVPVDVRDAASVGALFDQARHHLGPLGLLFNNAGVTGPAQPVEEVSEQDWTATVDTNLTGAFLCAQAAYRLMLRQRPRGGRIINNGSVSAQVPRPHTVAYTATKHAITGLTKALALEGRRHDIACGQIDIGNAHTPMTRTIAAGTRQADDTRAAEPTFDAEEVARTVVHMAGLPLQANIPFITIMATAMPLFGRG
ncbi:SDR family oxidoreductase [Amycolatopsis viridis]|uniref:NAD(P)-dependent dehydrogenase (Short-subunit alcohol dehydrogenase family) n=1 Tax=Amycolatopsis viridis TaxID=185678 RepID=A0ABX0SQ71_9PSEU|nr:SDR family oxidoreductase [Amycolatopsis viridis]NIH79097.1 NAD(P)-dependent dehydrogenase (short-subunit alcohol dehydrogenase family) [Amycolatopsis viridis]